MAGHLWSSGTVWSNYIKIPQYWYDLSDTIRKKRLTNYYLNTPRPPFQKGFSENDNVSPKPYLYRWESGAMPPYDPVSIYFVPNTISFSIRDIYPFDKINKLTFQHIPNADQFIYLLNILGVKYIIQQNDILYDGSDPDRLLFNGKDLRENFWGKLDPMTPKKMKKYLSENNQLRLVETIGEIDLYSLKGDSFLPLLFSSDPMNMTLLESFKDLAGLISSGFSDKLLIPFTLLDQNRDNLEVVQYLLNKNMVHQNEIMPPQGQLITPTNKGHYSNNDSPIIEYKKINPTKYRIRIHKAKKSFFLNFSQSFHNKWKLYIGRTPGTINTKQDLTGYKILDGNDDDQARIEELADFIRNGWITTLGDLKDKSIRHQKWGNGKLRFDYAEKYKIDFISKNFKNTIQNNNLPDKQFFETWLMDPIDDSNTRLVVNGFANSWLIKLNQIKKSENYLKNTDGSIDFELVLEFLPQKTYYLSMFISGLTLLTLLIICTWQFPKK